jgi:hypothetical protein
MTVMPALHPGHDDGKVGISGGRYYSNTVLEEGVGLAITTILFKI